MKRTISLLLALLTCLLCLVACSGQKTGDDSTSGSPSDVTEPKETVFSKELLNQFKIVYPNGSKNTVVEAANDLAKTIGKHTGVTLQITTDNISQGSSFFTEYEYEILVGETNRKESGEFLSQVRYSDYGYSCVGTKIVIGAHSTELLVKAIKAFNSDVISARRNEDILFRKGWEKMFEGEYNIKSMTVNGVGITDYKIVYASEEGSFGKVLADKLQDAITERCGAVLSVLADNASEFAQHEILIGNTNRNVTAANRENGKGYMAVSDGKICLSGTTAYGNTVAVTAFIEKVVPDANGICALQISETEEYAKDEALVSSMSWNLLTGNLTTARSNNVIRSIAKYMPDTFGVQEANSVWMQKLPTALGDYYECVGTSRGGKEPESCAIFYAKEKFELLDQGTYWITDTPNEYSMLDDQKYPRIFTFVLLKDKTTGQQLVHVNTHLEVATVSGKDPSSVRYREAMLLLDFLKRYNDIPVILSGDMNCTLDTQELQLLLNNAFDYPADVLGVNIPQTFEGGSVIDFIFMTTDSITPVSYLTDACVIDGAWSSDHCCVYTTFRFKTVSDLDHGWDNIQIPEEPAVEGQLTLKPIPEDDSTMGELHGWR